MKLHELVSQRTVLNKELSDLDAAHYKSRDILIKNIKALSTIISVGTAGYDVEKVQLAESLLYISGNVWNSCEGRVLSQVAIEDIAADCPRLSKQYFGNKKYDRFYQQCDCEYGMGPSHGGIVESISLKDRHHTMTSEEKDACIYYLSNIEQITLIERSIISKYDGGK